MAANSPAPCGLPVEPNYGTVPAGSAPAAAMQALNQMRAGTENMEQPPPVSIREKPAAAAPPRRPHQAGRPRAN